MKLILSISNERLRFKVNVSMYGLYEVNIGTSFKHLNNMKSCTPLDLLTLNLDYKINSIYFI